MQRTRSQVDIPPINEYYYRNFSVGGQSEVLGPLVVGYDNRHMIDIEVPRFKSRSAAGETIVNPMNFSRYSRDSGGSGNESFVSRRPDGSTEVAFTGHGNVTLLIDTAFKYGSAVVDSDLLVEQAKLKALSSMDSTPLSTGEDLLELRETLSYLRNPLKGIVSTARGFNISNLSLMSAKAWANYRFAFQPLVRSIHEILSEMKTPTPKPPLFRVSHGRASLTRTANGTAHSPNTLGGTHQAEWSHEVSCDVHAFIRYCMKRPSADFTWRYGLRGKDFPATFWAVMPLSFMVDRVLDISSMIKAITNLSDPNLQIMGCGYTVKSTKTLTRAVVRSTVNSAAFPRVHYELRGPRVTDKQFDMARVLWSPSIRDVDPSFTPKGLVDDFTKTADLAALLRLFAN